MFACACACACACAPGCNPIRPRLQPHLPQPATLCEQVVFVDTFKQYLTLFGHKLPVLAPSLEREPYPNPNHNPNPNPNPPHPTPKPKPKPKP
jgi:hypothetical protein